MTTYHTLWHKIFGSDAVRNTIINPNDENVRAVYYYAEADQADVLLYGNAINPSGDVMTLPRLYLGYYALIAALITVLSLAALAIFRQHKKVFSLSLNLLFLSMAYLLAHLLIKGFSIHSYSAARDFYAIVLVMVSLYVAMRLIYRIFKRSTS